MRPTVLRPLVALALASAIGCSGARNGNMLPPGGADMSMGGGGGDMAGVAMPEGTASVYAHSDSDLYAIDPDTLAITHIGPFQWPSGSDQMTDIALDKNGNMIGISFGSIYSVDPKTAKCTFLSNFSGATFNGLSFIAADQIDPNAAEILVAAAEDGSVYQIDPTNGQQTPLGNYGMGFGSSGDIVSVQGATYATVIGNDPSDMLVRVDALTGVATPIGVTGFGGIWGLGYWKQRVFGFTDNNEFVIIDVNTGQATKVQSGSVMWWGAGVTTAAPTTPVQ